MTESKAADIRDDILAELFDELTNRLQAGEAVDIEPYLRRYPEYEATLKSFLPAIEILVGLGRSTHSSRPHNNSVAPPSASELGALGDFQLLRELGRGGMGIVYEALQLSLNRRVALKVLPFATALDAKQLQRFKNEAQAAACLHHQHIVSVYGVGCERGVHFYAMQFIEGQTLADLIRELRQRGGLDDAEGASRKAVTDSTLRTAAALTADLSDKPSVHFRAVARLGMQAARGLEHAHQFGVVHRDIKPANLLLDQRGDLWITDFGLAHCQSQVGLTMTGDMVGTLRYMSPEQAMAARVPIDQRVDIYSLGATLYELLTLQPPFGGSDRRELLRQICFEEPRPLRRINKEIPEELETIVLKAMAKSPGDRYASAQDLMEDLERFLEHKPIRAKRPTVLQRAKKLTRRHQGVTVTAGIAAGLVLLLVVGFLLYRNSLVAHQRDEADQLRLLAEERFQQARQAVDTMYTQFAKKWLAQQPQMEPVEREFLNKALAFYEKLAGESSPDPRVRFETAQAYERVAEIQHQLGESEQAEKAYGQAVPLLQGLVNDFPQDQEYRRELALSLHSLGVLWGDTGRLPEEEVAHRNALTIQRKLAEDFPSVPAYRRDLARGMYLLGCKHMFSGRWDPAVDYLTQAAALQQVLTLELPGVPEIRAELAESLVRLATEKSTRQAADILEKLLADFPGNPIYRNSLAESYYFLAERVPRREAEQAIHRAIAIQEKLLADFPKITNNRFDLYRSHLTLARILSQDNRPGEAIAIYRKGLALGEQLAIIPKVDYFRNRLAEGHRDFGGLLVTTGRLSEAEPEYQRAITLYESLTAEFPKNDEYQRSLKSMKQMLASVRERLARRQDPALK